jgi:transcriptional regulator with XRE-family HTH domain
VHVNVSKLRLVRDAAGLSREKLARKVDLSTVQIWRIETKRSKPSADTLGAWAEACGVAVAELYESDTEAA